eukprot:COSAG02_NODE_750_length_17669_cov_242.395595_1_plen_85_part_00
MFHHRSGHQSNTPVNNFGPQSFYIILYPTCDGTFRIPGVTNPVESTLALTLLTRVMDADSPTQESHCDSGGLWRHRPTVGGHSQ